MSDTDAKTPQKIKNEQLNDWNHVHEIKREREQKPDSIYCDQKRLCTILS